jgi:hypothetical protein
MRRQRLKIKFGSSGYGNSYTPHIRSDAASLSPGNPGSDAAVPNLHPTSRRRNQMLGDLLAPVLGLLATLKLRLKLG